MYTSLVFGWLTDTNILFDGSLKSLEYYFTQERLILGLTDLIHFYNSGFHENCIWVLVTGEWSNQSKNNIKIELDFE